MIYSSARNKHSKLLAAIFASLLFLFGNLSCGPQDRKELKPITNSPPTISSITLLPERPTAETEISVFVQGHDPDGDPVTYQYQWLRNDEEIAGENKNSLKSGIAKKGDLIQVRITPSDGKTNGEAFLSSPLRIFNASPVIREVWVEPKVAYVTDRLSAHVKSSDIDGDSIHCSYQWEMNGSVLNEERGEFLERGRLKKGDTIAVTVTPDDVEFTRPPKKSEPITIANSPPIIISSPPNKTDGAIYTYQVAANDPDSDPVVFALKTSPKGMKIDKETGLIRWKVTREDQGTQSIEIEVSDSEGAKSYQRYAVSIRHK